MRKRFLVCLLMLTFLLSGCRGYKYHNMTADDAISKAVYETLGEDVYYQGKLDNPNVEMYYRYLVREYREDLLCDLVVAVNETIQSEKITEKTDVNLYYEVSGGIGSAVRLCNYSKNELDIPDCDGLQRLVIGGSEELDSMEFFNNPNIYITIPNIKYLEISERIQRTAEEKGIDWYEYWPDLESIEVFE